MLSLDGEPHWLKRQRVAYDRRSGQLPNVFVVFGVDKRCSHGRSKRRQTKYGETWELWAGGQGFEICRSAGPPVPAFGSEADVALIRKDGRLEAAELRFRGYDTRVQEALVREFEIEDPGDQEPYQRAAASLSRELPPIIVAGPSQDPIDLAPIQLLNLPRKHGCHP